MAPFLPPSSPDELTVPSWYMMHTLFTLSDSVGVGRRIEDVLYKGPNLTLELISHLSESCHSRVIPVITDYLMWRKCSGREDHCNEIKISWTVIDRWGPSYQMRSNPSESTLERIATLFDLFSALVVICQEHIPFPILYSRRRCWVSRLLVLEGGKWFGLWLTGEYRKIKKKKSLTPPISCLCFFCQDRAISSTTDISMGMYRYWN